MKLIKDAARDFLITLATSEGNITAKGSVGVVTDGFSPACPESSIVVDLILTCSVFSLVQKEFPVRTFPETLFYSAFPDAEVFRDDLNIC